MRRKLVVGNWKMNLTEREAAAAVQSFLRTVDQKQETGVAVCPSYISIPRVRELLRGSHVLLGAQDVFWKESGAFTGQVSAAMLADAGVRVCIVGHSETRGRFGALEVPESTLGYFAETDETVNRKVCALLYHDITPIVCVGETLAERDTGETDAIVRRQVSLALDGVEAAEFRSGVFAYEPVWAIGTGRTCDAAEANRVCGLIRATLAEALDGEAAASVRVLYGGSVKASNAEELFDQPEIDGGLVGGASLAAHEFSRIVLCA